MVTSDSLNRLEPLVALLNTWWVDNGDTTEHDDVETWADSNGVVDVAGLRRFRNELRRGVEEPSQMDQLANSWMVRHQVGIVVRDHRLAVDAVDDAMSVLVAVVIDALRDAELPRLKACPDCRWVFVDHTRNNSKRWCVMNASSPLGRSCGNRAKARRHRARLAGLSG